MKNETLLAYTAPGPDYPEYFNISIEGDDAVVTVREKAEFIPHGIHLCGVTCHPGGPNCNNYCNMHPDKSKPMADRALPNPHHKEGKTVSMRLPLSQLRAMLAEIEAEG